MDAKASVNNIVIEAVIVRKDGTREPQGVIAEIKAEEKKESFFRKILGGK